MKPDGSLSARIHSINEYGHVRIKFSKNVIKIENITQIDKTVLNITTESAYSPNDIRDIRLSFWNATFMSKKELRLSLYFKNPLQISTFEVIF